MKKYIFCGIVLSALMATTASCTDNDYTELDKGSEPLALTSSSANIVLEEKAHANNAFELKWTTGTNSGTGNRISYTLKLAEAGTQFTDAVVVKDNEARVYNWAPNVEQLNTILLSRMGAEAGQPMELEAMITATVAGNDADQQTATCKFTVTPYEPVTETLYLIGDATPNGWSADNATEMVRIDNGIFTWTGTLKPGSFKFIVNKGEFIPSYNNNGHGGLVYRTSFDQPDETFSIEEEKNYKVDVNLLNMSVTFVETTGTALPFDQIYFVGETTDWGFVLMNQDPLDSFLFRIGWFFDAKSEFKFGTSDGSWEKMYKATEANAPYTSEGVELIEGFDPDNKWLLTESQAKMAYKICLDIRPNKERMIMRPFTPYTEMYLVGSATANGWDLANATPMTVDPSNPNIFMWTGNLQAGELKFSADKQSDWNGAWFLASSENAEPTGTVEKTIFVDKSDDSFKNQYPDIAVGDVDRKWNITQPGSYTITLNQLLEEVSIVHN